MSDLKQRNYYKIFTGTNQESGYDKIHLGYEANTTEVVFKKDQSTYFHIPYFANTQTIQDSTLIADGATPGPIPALADRIYKKLGGYGNTTPMGNTVDQNDGTWLCTWLYAISSEPPQWVDRYYNTGRLAYEEALEGKANFDDFYKNDPIYYDVPSVMTFESGVLYQYLHQGENTIKEIVNTFAGNDKSRLKLNLEDWSCMCINNPHPIDSSIYNNAVEIKNFKEDWIVSLLDPGFQDRNSLSFNNNDFVECKILYNENFYTKNEFTISFWVNHDNWSNATSTQLAGNLRDGGYGVFYNNLNQNPFFIIPENTYGHLFYSNQDAVVYLDKNTQFTLGEPSNPVSVALNSLSEVLILDSKNKRIIKYDHIGNVLALNKDKNSNFILDGDPKNLILNGDDDCTVITTSATYIFDKNLILKSKTNSNYSDDQCIAYNLSGALITQNDCKDLKFDNSNRKWVIKTDNNVYCDDILVDTIPSTNKSTNVAIDPENNIWVLFGSNLIYKINPETKEIINLFEVGVFSNEIDDKNIGFIKSYNREKNKHYWYAVLYHNFEKNLYFVTLDGDIYKNIYLPDRLNINEASTALQNKNILSFSGKGDFTGYENKRIFNKLKFNNNHQIRFSLAAKSPNNSIPNTIYSVSVPVPYFSDKTWYLITATFKNKTMNLYINNYLRDSITIPGNIDMNFDYKTNFYLGTPAGKVDNFNSEINSKSVIWNGYLDSVKIYDYAMEPKFIQYLVREKIKPIDIIWNIPTTPLQYVETIDRFFKHKMPGFKSQFFNIRIEGSSITDLTTKNAIENEIRNAVDQIKPAYTDLLKIEWID
jgi:hypothetical protein